MAIRTLHRWQGLSNNFNLDFLWFTFRLSLTSGIPLLLISTCALSKRRWRISELSWAAGRKLMCKWPSCRGSCELRACSNYLVNLVLACTGSDCVYVVAENQHHLCLCSHWSMCHSMPLIWVSLSLSLIWPGLGFWTESFSFLVSLKHCCCCCFFLSSQILVAVIRFNFLLTHSFWLHNNKKFGVLSFHL